MGTITESKMKKGILTLDKQDFATQSNNITISPEYKDEGDALEVLSGDTLAKEKKRSDTLKIKFIQDFTNPAGVVNYLWENDLKTVAFVWQPSGVTGPKFAGNVELVAPEVGGDVNVRLEGSVELSVVGTVTYTKATASMVHDLT